MCVWPSPLCLDYGWPAASDAGEILPGALSSLGCRLAATALGLLVRKASGFPAVRGSSLILLPTSSVVPLAVWHFEHRMYLPLAAVVTAVAARRTRRSTCPAAE